MKPIEFSKEERAAITAKLRDYFARELDQELGQLPAEMLLDFIGTEIGGAFYNRGVHDAQQLVQQKAEDIVEEAEARAVGDGTREEFGQSMTDLVKEAPELSDEERGQAIEFLSRPDLVETILEDMEQLGYVGEEKGKLLAYLVGLSRKLEKPLAAYVNSESSAGKSGMTEAVEALTAPEDVVNFARLSTHALSYMPPTFFGSPQNLSKIVR